MLFDDNIGFMTFDLGSSYSNNLKENKLSNVLNPEEGFLRGNMYKDEFKPYKNYTYRKMPLMI